MNQILITEKLYITPELKRKKKIYKFNFFISLFVVFVLISACIYAEYDRNKSEETSQEILASINEQVDTTIAKSDILVVILDEENEINEQEEQEIIEEQQKAVETNDTNRVVQTTKNGYKYATIATINIPQISVNYPILDGETDSVEETEALLKIAPTKFWGADPNEVGNFCVVGHNYRNKKFFSKVPTLENGDIIEITDLSGKTIQYKIYDKYEVDPSDTDCTTQLTNGRKEITLITCTNDSKLRVIVKARAI